MKKLFVICPIGEIGTLTRERSDMVLEYIIKPAAESCGYSVIRGDQTPSPAAITIDIVNQLLDSDVVIADLTDDNPNVHYELGIRHAIGKPVIQIIEQTQSKDIPFDVRQMRTIEFDYTSLPSAMQCQAKIKEAIKSIESGSHRAINPIVAALSIRAQSQNTTPLETSLGEIISLLQKSSLADEKYTNILTQLDKISSILQITTSNPYHEAELHFERERTYLYQRAYEEQFVRTMQIIEMFTGKDKKDTKDQDTQLPPQPNLDYLSGGVEDYADSDIMPSPQLTDEGEDKS